jgi:hypothetical protein
MTSCLLVSTHVITQVSVDRLFKKKIKTFSQKYLHSKCIFYPYNLDNTNQNFARVSAINFRCLLNKTLNKASYISYSLKYSGSFKHVLG